MDNFKKLETFYFGELKNTLHHIEKSRKKTVNNIIRNLCIFTFLYCLMCFFLIQARIDSNTFGFIFYAFFPIFIMVYQSSRSQYDSNFKDMIVKPLVRSLGESFEYYQYKHISFNAFSKSELISEADNISGDDYVRGKINGVKIEFSDVVGLKKTSGESEYKSFFNGFFIRSSFNKSFHGKTFVLPDNSQTTFGALVGNWLQSKTSSKGELVKMDNHQFEKEFVVFSSDQIEARYILTPSMMERLLEFKKKCVHPFSISFIDDCIHIVIDTGKDNFEPILFQSLLDYDVAIQYFINIYLASAVVNDLKLNEKLWGKK